MNLSARSRELEAGEDLKPRGPQKKRAVSSKYDVYKVTAPVLFRSAPRLRVGLWMGNDFFLWHTHAQVKVWLGENKDHYYVLSRFLISRRCGYP